MLVLNVPFALATLVLAVRVLPRPDGARVRRLDVDVPGIVLLGTLTVLVTLPVVDPGLPRRGATALAAGVLVVAVALVGWERRYTRHGRLALFAPALVAHPGFVAGNVVALLWFGALVAHGTVLTLYLVQGAGVTGIAVALVLVPSALSRMLGSSLAARVLDRYGPRTIGASLAVQVAGVAGLAVAAVTTDGTRLLLVVVLVESVVGAASGLVEPPLRAVTLGFAPAGLHGVAASFLQLTQRLAATLAVAVASGLLFRGSAAVTTAGSFAGALAFCAVLLALATAVACAPRLRRRPDPAHRPVPTDTPAVALAVGGTPTATR